MATCASQITRLSVSSCLSTADYPNGNSINTKHIKGSLSVRINALKSSSFSPLTRVHHPLTTKKQQRPHQPIRAQASEESTEEAKFGLGGPGTWFGFGPRQERNVGRLAMMGFAAALVMEVLTGKGVFGQLGLNPEVIRVPFLASLSFLFVGGLLGGYVVINNPPDFGKIPENDGAGIPRDPLKTFDSSYVDPLTTFSRGGVTDRPGGQKGREPYASDLDLPKK